MRRIIETLRAVRPAAMLAVSAAVLGLLLVVQGVRYARADRVGNRFTETLETGLRNPQVEHEAPQKRYANVLEKGLFGKPGTPAPPKLFGILGDRALLGQKENNAKLHGVGDDVADGYKLVAIELNKVVVEREDQRKDLELFPTLNAPPVAASTPERAAVPETDDTTASPPEVRAGDRAGGANLRERMSNASPQERRELMRKMMKERRRRREQN